MNALAPHELHKPIGKLRRFDRNLQVEIAARIGYEPAAQKRSAQICSRAALLGYKRRRNPHFEAGLA